MLGTLADLLGNANGQTPLVVVVAGAVLLAAGWIGRKAFGSQQRQGRRIGVLEQLARSERTRRRQLEQTLREHGVRLSYWPDDPPELYAVQQRADDDQADDVGDDIPATRYITDDEREAYARHRRQRL